MKKLFTLIVTITAALTTFSQTTVGWNFGTTAGNASPSSGTPVSNLTVSALAQGNNNGTTTLLTTTSASSGYTNTSGSYNAGAAARIGALNTAAGGSAYFEFTLTPDAGYTVSVSSISFGSRSTSTGPQAYSIRTSLNNYGADAATGTLSSTGTWALITPAVTLSNSGAITVRIYGYNGTGSPAAGTANWRIDDLAVTVTVTGSGGDVTAPVVSSTSPANNATVNSLTFTAAINFSEKVTKVNGTTGNIYVRELNTGNAVQTIPVSSAGVVVSNNVVTFGVTGLSYATMYYVEIDANTFADLSANANNFAGLSGNTAWRFTTMNAPSAGVQGFTYNFNTCGQYTSQGFTTYDVLGAQSWGCTAFGRTYPGTGVSSDSAIQISGAVGSTPLANTDWFISPKFDLSSTNVPLLKFYSRTKFAGNALSLKVSTNYNGSGDPNAATWTDINGKFPQENSDVWTLSDSVNLSAFKTSNVYVAWVYTSTASAGARWTLDDITFYDATAAPPPNITLYPTNYDFGIVAAGSNSYWKSFAFTSSDFSGGVTFTVPTGFSVAKDSTAAGGSSINYTTAEMNSGTKTFYVRFAPTAPDKNFSGYINATASGGYNVNLALVTGSTYLMSHTLDLVNWNIGWFGSTEAGNGPTDKNQQEANVKTVVRNLNADLYAFSEVVDTMRFRKVAETLGANYGFVVADYASYAPDASDPDYAGAQKNGFIYSKDIFSNVTTRGLLRYHATQDQTDSTSYYWASGRFPFLLNADVTMNGATKNINFIVIHGKANTGTAADEIEAYRRRKLAAQELKDTLDANFANANVVLLGDFNDDLDRTIAPTTGADTVSSYNVFVADSTDGISYRSLTLPLSLQGLHSTASNPDIIDHVIVNDDFFGSYISGSASLRSDVANLVTNYSTTTTDHYPVMTRYLFASAAPLPAKLVSFSAVKNSSTVNLNWTTSQEINTKEFVVERSLDGARYETLATVAAKGASAVPVSYATVDARPSQGLNYYRLRTVDADGKTSLSNVVKINFAKGFTVSLSPNPATDYVLVTLAGTQKPVVMQLVNAAGKLIKTATITNGTNRIITTGLAKGLYAVRFIGLNEVYTEKLMIQ